MSKTLSLLTKICPKCRLQRTNLVLKPWQSIQGSIRSLTMTPPTPADPTPHSDPPRLYPAHTPTSRLQKILLSVGAAAVALADPWRGDMVAALGETTGSHALVKIHQKMLNNEVGRQILQDRPRITTKTVDLSYLRTLPVETLGRTYVTWLDQNGADPDSRPAVQFIDDPGLAYVMQRYREVHDLYHAVLGMPTTMLGEVTVKWFEAVQLGLPMCGLAAVGGPVRLGPRHMELFLKSHLPWAIKNGLQSNLFMNFYFERHWETELSTVREELNLEDPPTTPQRRQNAR